MSRSPNPQPPSLAVIPLPYTFAIENLTRNVERNMTKKLVLTLIAAGVAFAAPATIAAAPQLTETRSTLKEWVELRKLISEERNKWRVEKETLNESIRLLQTEIENLSTAIEDKQGEANLADQARSELSAQEEELRLAIEEDQQAELELGENRLVMASRRGADDRR